MKIELNIILLVFILVISITLGFAQAEKMPKDFNFIFNFGCDFINTNDNTYTKDMVIGLPFIAKFKVLKKDKKIIYKKLVEIKFWDFPEQNICIKDEPVDYYDSTGTLYMRKYPTNNQNTYYTLRVKCNNKNNKVTWEVCGKDRILNIEHEKLLQVGDIIINIIRSNKALKLMPPRRGGYI